ncbi:MFS transporter, DHA1 family, putative efflux transporter [Paenibacillus catalpae]|uniref:MFS transporter, DHA1 family, putative efflux transporter n=1 Tax=Paenibacillus catalpae TaxID=1045775 RepID=A0A1I2BJM0_9BACL|nr:MFS transporter [Paenibacillus catalpae]SFE55473.1 MFS transporter, DHA1 family, putative efflux transporter [Paenibacillus catalpae]
MNRLVIYLLMIAVFFTATSELVIAGILNVLAEQMHISVSLAGQLITAYSLAFAIGTPIIIATTAKWPRKKLLLTAMAVFIGGNFLSIAGTGFVLLMAARMLLGVSSGVFIVAAFSAAAKMVPVEKIGSAMGTIILGFSSAMILGVPLGVALTNMYNWQMIFMFLGAGGIVILIGLALLLPQIEGDAPVPFRQQLAVLANPVIFFALLLVLFREAGNSVMFTYIASFLGDILHRSTTEIGLMMLLFGLAGAVGSRIGGSAVDKWGSAKLIMIGVMIHVIALLLLPLAVHSFPVAITLLSLWIMSMFTLGPATQTYFIERAPQSSNLIISLNISVTQVGIAAGASVGGLVVNWQETVLYNPLAAGIVLILALASAAVSIRKSRQNLPQIKA